MPVTRALFAPTEPSVPSAAVNAVITSALVIVAPSSTSASSVPSDSVSLPTRLAGTNSFMRVLVFVSNASCASTVMPSLMLTSSSCTFSVRLSTPTTSALPARACRLVKLRLASFGSLISARPKFTSPRLRPIASSSPARTPANACTSLPPIVTRSASLITVPSDSVTCWLRLSTANCPCTLKKPNRSMSSVPAALMISPSAPSIVSVSVVVALVGTLSSVLRAAASSFASAVSA